MENKNMDELTEDEIKEFRKDEKFKKVMHKYCLDLIGSDSDHIEIKLLNKGK